MNKFVLFAFLFFLFSGCIAMNQQVKTVAEEKNVVPTPIRTVEGITEYQLPNGLKVLLFPDDSQSTVTVNITYLVGSRHEGRGEAGMAHLLEHMLFKGTPLYPDTKGVLQDKGAFFNATTWYDRTNYFETLPASDDNLKFALEFECDRMQNSWIRKTDLDAEMTVVRNEFEIGENDPVGVLHDKIMSAAYQWHNYGKSTIGNRSDIERVPVESLQQFYKKYYQPDNAVVIIAGKFDEKLALTQVQKTFGEVAKPNRVLDATYTEEPAQDGARKVKLMRVGDVASIGAAYHIPAGSHADHAAIRILSDVLTSEPGGFLYKKLVKIGLASEVFGFPYALAEPGVFMIFAKPTDAKNVFKVEDKMLFLTENKHQEAITKETVERAKIKLLKNYKLAMSNSKDLALKLSESIAQGGFELFFWYRDQVKSVTVEDVKRVANRYLIESNRTAGVFIPTKDPVRVEVPLTQNVTEMLKKYEGSDSLVSGEKFEASIDNIEKSTERSTLQNGIKVALLPKQTRGDLVKASLIFRFGTEKDLTGHNEAQALIPQMLMRGTTKHNFQALQDKLDALQSTMSIHAFTGGAVVNMTSDRSHILQLIDLLAEVMQKPKFDKNEFAIIVKKELTQLEEGLNDPQQVGFNELSRLTNPWPKNSIHYVPTYEEKMKEIALLKVEELKKLYHEFYGANHLEVAIVGAFDADEIKNALNKNFGKWSSKKPFVMITKPYKPAENELKVVYTADKQMAVLAMGANMKLRDDDPDYAAVRFANYVFGESMKSYLMQRLREKEGLSYGAGSYISASKFEKNTSINMYAMAATQNANKALELIKEEYQNWLNNEINQGLLEESKQSFKSQLDNYLASDNYIVNTLSSNLVIGRTFRYQEEMLKKIFQLSPSNIKETLQKYLAKEPISKIKAGDFKN